VDELVGEFAFFPFPVPTVWFTCHIDVPFRSGCARSQSP
jgi:hypothetical protein